ncbi:MAG: SPOR domain-containing protein [Bacteroidales bacterium]|nr:SPOR domain-containing protein [Bacteroidales bacterium]
MPGSQLPDLKIRVVLLFVFLMVTVPLFAQHKIPSGYCITSQEEQVFEAINKIREAYKKKPLKLSVSLSFVARTHVQDLQVNHPDTSICNLSSWSNKGKWTPCCFNPYVVNQEGMWNKPKELTNYRYRGYELASYFQDGMNVDSLVRFLQDADDALDMILTQNAWEKKSWVCMGVGLSKNYASLWFGQREDAAGAPKLCHKGKKVSDKTVVKAKVYYLIAGSFPNKSDAKEALRRFKKNGYKDAGILEGKGRVRIYLARYKSFTEASNAKKKLPYNHRKAWILEGTR